MPMAPAEVAKHLNALLNGSAKPIITIPWDDAYRMTDMRHWRRSRTEQIEEAAYDEYGIIVTYGNAGLFVMRDDNFSPV